MLHELMSPQASAPRLWLPASLYLLHPCSRAIAPYLRPAGNWFSVNVPDFALPPPSLESSDEGSMRAHNVPRLQGWRR